MQKVSRQELIDIANELAQQQEEYFDGFVIDTFKIEGGIFAFQAQGLNDVDGKLSLSKFELGNTIIQKIEPILRENYIILE